MHYVSPTVYVYFLWCGHVVNRGQQNFGGFLFVGSNCSYFSENNNNNNNNNNNKNELQSASIPEWMVDALRWLAWLI